MKRVIIYNHEQLSLYKGNGQVVHYHVSLEHFFNHQPMLSYIDTSYQTWCHWWYHHFSQHHYLLPYFHEKNIWCPFTALNKDGYCMNISQLKQFYEEDGYVRCEFADETYVLLPISLTRMYAILERVSLILDGFHDIGAAPWLDTKEWQENNPYLLLHKKLQRKGNKERLEHKMAEIKKNFTFYNLYQLNEIQKNKSFYLEDYQFTPNKEQDCLSLADYNISFGSIKKLGGGQRSLVINSKGWMSVV